MSHNQPPHHQQGHHPQPHAAAPQPNEHSPTAEELPAINPAFGLGDVLQLLPIAEELVTLYPRLAQATVGGEVDLPVVSNLRIAHGRWDGTLTLKKTG